MAVGTNPTCLQEVITYLKDGKKVTYKGQPIRFVKPWAKGIRISDGGAFNMKNYEVDHDR